MFFLRCGALAKISGECDVLFVITERHADTPLEIVVIRGAYSFHRKSGPPPSQREALALQGPLGEGGFSIVRLPRGGSCRRR